MITIKDSHTLVFPIKNQKMRMMYWADCNFPNVGKLQSVVTNSDPVSVISKLAGQLGLITQQFPIEQATRATERELGFLFYYSGTDKIIGFTTMEQRLEDPSSMTSVGYIPTFNVSIYGSTELLCRIGQFTAKW